MNAVNTLSALCLLLAVHTQMSVACPDRCVCGTGPIVNCNGDIDLSKPFPDNTERVNMNNFNLLTIPDGAFYGVNSLQFIGGNIGTIHRGGFQGLGQDSSRREPCSVEFQDVTMKNISTGAFSGACLNGNPGQLKIKGADIELFAQEAISNCTFEVIQIKESNLTDVQSRVFGADLNVKEVRLEYVTMEEVPSSFWVGLQGPGPHVLEISNAAIGTIKPAAFAGVNNIKVNLKKCNISLVHTEAFSGAEHVTSITIQHSDIGLIEKNVFGNVTSDGSPSSFIHVINNAIQTVRAQAFEGIPTFSSLNIKNNDIGCWEAGAFDNVQSKKVSIENNNGMVCGGCMIEVSYIQLIIMSISTLCLLR